MRYFGPGRISVTEITWKRTPFSGSSKARAQQLAALPRRHPLLYQERQRGHGIAPTQPYSDEYLTRFKWDDDNGRVPYRKTLLKTYSDETFKRLEAENRLVAPIKPGAKWSYKQYLAEQWHDADRRRVDGHQRPQLRSHRSGSATRRRSRSRCWNTSSRRPPTRAMSYSTRSAGAAPPSRGPEAETADGSASTSPIWPST